MATRLKIPFFCMAIKRGFTRWLQYRYLTLGMTLWAKMHFYLLLTHKFFFGIYKRTEIKLIKNVTFCLGTKVFVLCNFCFEKYCLFLTLTNQIAKREALRLKCN
ncbi:hypothetical protein YA46_11310 [Enterobacter hormaechei subsp. xiangfangensis]|nr:hypothetical protein YA46_11310 [Enterobacter hormaechei subsp. xiangfangensis]